MNNIINNILNYNEAYTFLVEVAQKQDWKYYEIVEDSYEYSNGLLLIGYRDKQYSIEIDHICIPVKD